MVNGHGQFSDPDFTGRIVSYESGDGWAAVTMDLSRAYPPDVSLGRFTRTLVYLKPRTLVLIDRLQGAGDNYLRRYEWLLHSDPDSTGWECRDDLIKAVDIRDGQPWLVGRVFPSYRYYFERQSLDRPDGKPLNRALSLTIIGRMPSRIEIAAMLHVPAQDEDLGWLHRTSFVRTGSSTSVMVPDGPYFVIPTGPKGRPTRTVISANADTVDIPREVPSKGQIIITNLTAEMGYSLIEPGIADGVAFRLVPDKEGKLTSSKSGNLVLVDLK